MDFNRYVYAKGEAYILLAEVLLGIFESSYSEVFLEVLIIKQESPRVVMI